MGAFPNELPDLGHDRAPRDKVLPSGFPAAAQGARPVGACLFGVVVVVAVGVPLALKGVDWDAVSAPRKALLLGARRP